MEPGREPPCKRQRVEASSSRRREPSPNEDPEDLHRRRMEAGDIPLLPDSRRPRTRPSTPPPPPDDDEGPAAPVSPAPTTPRISRTNQLLAIVQELQIGHEVVVDRLDRIELDICHMRGEQQRLLEYFGLQPRFPVSPRLHRSSSSSADNSVQDPVPSPALAPASSHAALPASPPAPAPRLPPSPAPVADRVLPPVADPALLPHSPVSSASTVPSAATAPLLAAAAPLVFSPPRLRASSAPVSAGRSPVHSISREIYPGGLVLPAMPAPPTAVIEISDDSDTDHAPTSHYRPVKDEAMDGLPPPPASPAATDP